MKWEKGVLHAVPTLSSSFVTFPTYPIAAEVDRRALF